MTEYEYPVEEFNAAVGRHKMSYQTLEDEKWLDVLIQMTNRIMQAVKDAEPVASDGVTRAYNRRQLEKQIYSILKQYTKPS